MFCFLLFTLALSVCYGILGVEVVRMFTVIFHAHFWAEDAECSTYVHAVEGPIGQVRDFVSQETADLLGSGFEEVEVQIIDPEGNDIK